MVYVSPWFLILHVATDYLIHPKGGALNPKEGTLLVLHPDRRDSERLLFRFVQAEGHWGYIEHRSGLILYPENPKHADFCYLVKARKDGCLVTIDQANDEIVNKNGRMVFGIDDFKITGYPPFPDPGYVLYYNRGSQPSAVGKWKFVSDSTFKDVQVFPNPNVSGFWNIVDTEMNPTSGHTKEIVYKIGRTKTTTNQEESAWKISTEFAKSVFQASSNFTKPLSKTGRQTWEEEITRTKKITCK